MASIILSACLGHTTQEDGYRTLTCEPFSSVGTRETVEAKTVQAIREAVAAYGNKLKAENPGVSFLVSATVARGSRKPNGFDAANRGNGLGGRNWLELRDAKGERLLSADRERAMEARP